MRKGFLIYTYFCLICFNIAADGCFVLKTNEHAVEPTQSAVIFYDEGVQDTFLQVGFEGEASEFGWLVPVPSKPQVEEIKSIPDVTGHPLFETPLRHLHMYKALMGTLGGDETPKPKLSIEKVLLPSYEVNIIAPKGNGLQLWLDGNGFKTTPKSMKVINEYVAEKWYFCAVKLRLGDKKTKKSGLLPPVKFSFKTDKPVFPLKISAINNSPSLVKIKFIAPEIYTPDVEIKAEDILREKDAIKYIFHGERGPVDTVWYPLLVSKSDEVTSITKFRKSAKPVVYSGLYISTYEKLFQAAEIDHDIYFKPGKEFANKQVKRQEKLFYKRGYRKEYYTSALGGRFPLENNVMASKPVKHFTSLEETIDAIFWEENKSNRYDYEYYDELSDDSYDAPKNFFKCRLAFSTKSDEGDLVYNNILTLQELKDLVLECHKNRKVSDKFAELQNRHERFVELDFSFKDEDGYKKDYADTADYTVYKSWYRGRNIIQKLKAALSDWAPSITTPVPVKRVYKKTSPSVAEFASISDKLSVSKEIKVIPVIYNENGYYDGEELFFPLNYYESEIFKYLYETPLYLRKIVASKVSEKKSKIYLFSIADGKECPGNVEFINRMAKKDVGLVDEIVPWLKSENRHLRHNAIIALAHISFLSVDHADTADRKLLQYEEELDEYLPLDPSENDASYWACLLRIKYGLETCLDMLKIVNNPKFDDEAFEDALWSMEDIYTKKKDTKAVEVIEDISIRMVECSSFEVEKLFWAELAMNAARNNDLSDVEYILPQLKEHLEYNKEHREHRDAYWGCPWYDNIVYYSSAFMKNPKIKDLLLQYENIPELMMVREQIQPELSKWFAEQLQKTGNLCYKVLQPLCVKTCTLSPEDFHKFQKQYADVLKDPRLKPEMLKDVNNLWCVPYRTKDIHRFGIWKYLNKGTDKSELDDDFFLVHGGGMKGRADLFRMGANYFRYMGTPYYDIEIPEIVEVDEE